MNKFFWLFVFSTSSAFATSNQVDIYLGRGFPQSFAQASGSSVQEGSRGTAWSFDALHKVSERFYLGAGAGRFTSQDNVSATFAANTNSTIRSRVTSTFLLGRMDLVPGGKFVLYGIVGLGWVKNSLTVTATPETFWPGTRTTTEQRTLLDDSANAAGYLGGVGLDVELTDTIWLGLEVRYQGSMIKSFELTPEGVDATGRTSISGPLNFLILGIKASAKY